jgi:uncharacterized repeat protein (TIGR03803 family)
VQKNPHSLWRDAHSSAQFAAFPQNVLHNGGAAKKERRCSEKRTVLAPARVLESCPEEISQVIERSGNCIVRKIFVASVSAALMLVAALGFVAVTTPWASAQTYSVLYNFGGSADGGDPYAGLIRDTNGNLYGTVGYGGTAYAGGVYKVDAKGNETMLYSFTGGADGAYPISTLVRDNAGNLYGTTTQGGSVGAGVVFKVDPSGSETVLHNFTGGSDGVDPVGGLLLDTAGNLYGTTAQGGTSNSGVLFKLGPKGKETILHTFTGAANDGKYPTYTNVVMDAAGNIYGVTEEGGKTGHGVLYERSALGKFSILYSFAGGTADGCNVLGIPFRDRYGNFYGTTSSCGTSGLGTVWKLNKYGKETVLHSFAGSDGEYPLAGVIADGNGNLYGCTSTGGSANLGTVYKVTTNGQFTLLHSFAGPDGEYPYGSFVLNKGILYGTTQNGGSIGYGTVWQMTK